MESDVIFLDDNTPCENKIEPEVKLSSIKFLTKSFTKKGFSYSIKNGILYKENELFDFTGLVDFEGTFQFSEIRYQLFYSAQFLEGKLRDQIELMNFLIVFNKESSMQNFFNLLILKIKKWMIWKK